MKQSLLEWTINEIAHLELSITHKSDEGNIWYMRGRIDTLKEFIVKLNANNYHD